MMRVTLAKVRDVLLLAVADHLRDDRMGNVNERARVAQLLVALQRRMDESGEFRSLTVDSEYSVVGERHDPKFVALRRRYPDLIIHERGNPAGNVLVCEVKRRESSRPREGPDRQDARKIRQMVGLEQGLPPGIQPYRLGACVGLGESEAKVWWWASVDAEVPTVDWPFIDSVPGAHAEWVRQ